MTIDLPAVIEAVKITPAMRELCRYLAGSGVTLTRYNRTTGYHVRGGRLGGKSITYVMGLKLTDAGLITWTRKETLQTGSEYEHAILTNAGRTAALDTASGRVRT